MNFTDAVLHAIQTRRVEPEPRMHGGRFGYVFHKYPIKGGITPAEVMARQMSKTNTLFQRLSAETHKT